MTEGGGPSPDARAAVEAAIGYSFRDERLLREALTHSSYANESAGPGRRSNERLEFLGDAVLELCVSEILFAAHPNWDEGMLTRERSRIVCEGSLAHWAHDTGICGAISLSRGLAAQRVGGTEAIRADAMEALLGAVCLDGGIDAARGVVRAWLAERREPPAAETRDPKSRLQEMLQARGERPPGYELRERTGPDHASTFVVDLIMRPGEPPFTSGSGRSKKAAEFAAAEAALRRLASRDAGPDCR